MAAEVAELVREAAGLLRAEGRPKPAEAITTVLNRPRPDRPTVIVTGEDKRGKSSLVNAMLGTPDLSPIGVEVVTGSPVRFVHADARRAAVLHYGDVEAVETDFDEARHLATVQGNPQNEFNIRSVELGLDHPLLRELVLVDTPGVGGLESGHAALTLQSLASADALVFVLDSAVQIRAAELDFLRRASSRIETVIFALSKTDKHRAWRTVLDDDRRILEQQAPRFAACPFVPVSSVLALRALQLEDPDEVAELLAESGFTALGQLLVERVTERTELLTDGNRLRATVGPLSTAERALKDQLAAINSAGGNDELEREQARLKALNTERADWMRRLDTESRRISLLRNENLTMGLTDIRRRYDQRLREPTKEDMDSMPGELVADLVALAERINEETSERLIKLLTDILGDVDATTDIEAQIRKLTEERLGDQLASESLGEQHLNHYDKMSVLSYFSSGKSLAGLFSGGGLGAATGLAIAPPVGLALGVGMGAFYAYQAFKGKKQVMFTSEFRSWMNEQCGATQTAVGLTFQREMIDVQDGMRDLVRETLAAREEEINESLKAARAIKAAAAEQQARAKADLQARLGAIRALQTRINAALRSLRSAPAGAPQPAGGA